MELRIKVMGDERSLEVSGDATVGELKQIISQIFKQPPCIQKLSAVKSEGIVNLDDVSKSLSSYGLQSGSVLILLITKMFQVLVKNVNDTIGTYDVDVNESVDQLQTKIYNKERVPKDQQKLVYNGKQLEPGKKLQDYNIMSGDTIYMTLRLRGGS